MEDLWRLQKMGFRLNDLADHAEYQRFLDRFRAEEKRGHEERLLRGQQVFGPARPPRKSSPDA